MCVLSQRDVRRIMQLRKEMKDHWFDNFCRENPHCSRPQLLILDAPLESPETVQRSVGLAKLPSVVQATLDGDDGKGQEEKPISVCVLDERGHRAIISWILRNAKGKLKFIWVNVQGERREATKIIAC